MKQKVRVSFLTKIRNYLRKRRLMRNGYRPVLLGGLYARGNFDQKWKKKEEIVCNIMGEAIGTIIWNE